MRIRSMLCGVAFLLVPVASVASESANIIEAAQSVISRDMKDPSSTQFRDVAHYRRGTVNIVCGEVNAKNSYGAYVGFRRFLVLDRTPFLRDQHNAAAFEGSWALFCKPSAPTTEEGTMRTEPAEDATAL